MMVLITGGSGSGKSAYEEEYMMKISDGCRNYYIATMQVYGEEGKEKVRRHRIMREGKGFITIEQATNIQKAGEQMEHSSSVESCALLECMSNLVANEMFAEGPARSPEEVQRKILCGIKGLRKTLKNLVIVTNNVFEDGIAYDETTMDYIKAIGCINQELAKMADKVIEVVVGIPVVLKEGK